ncbi:hypothetical protein AVEN_104375-1 [Araneus ventricosus]|uniref:Uncharacterized protein n=1 Tax=Araneus ventricosus TaxID=182803 RepID=A0A4Y2MBJ0_ARAVE|nr:hypothetical protein AVEN_104375-1 [Araneus ventricosus]
MSAVIQIITTARSLHVPSAETLRSSILNASSIRGSLLLSPLLMEEDRGVSAGVDAGTLRSGIIVSRCSTSSAKHFLHCTTSDCRTSVKSNNLEKF